MADDNAELALINLKLDRILAQQAELREGIARMLNSMDRLEAQVAEMCHETRLYRAEVMVGLALQSGALPVIVWPAGLGRR